MNRFTAMALTALFLAASTVQAASKFYSYGPGTNTWDTVSNFWGTVSGGPYTTTWSANDAAIFEGTGGTVTLSGNQSANSVTFSVAGYAISNATLTLIAPATVTNTADGTISSIVAGTSGLTKTGAGILTLNGINTDSGLLTVGTGTVILSTSGGISWNGNAQINNGATLQLGSNEQIVNTGIVSIQNGGVLDLNGKTETIKSLYFSAAGSGTVTGGGGTIIISNGGADGIRAQAVGNYVVNAAVVLAGSSLDNSAGGAGSMVTLNGVLTESGANALEIYGNAGIFRLANVASYTGQTIVNFTGAILEVYNDGSGLPGANGRIANSSAINTLNGTVTTFRLLGGGTDAVADSIPVTVNASGTFDLQNPSETIGSLAGAGVVTRGISGLGVLTTGSNNTSTAFSGMIQDGSGTLSLVKTGSGTLTLSGVNTYSGDTTINAGRLELGSTGKLGNGAYNGTITNNAVLLVNNTVGQTFSGVVTGTGSLIKTNSGTLALSGNNTYSGGTTNLAGVLQIGAGGTSGMIPGDIPNSGALVFNRSDSVIFTGVVSGTGSLTQAGAGTLTLAATNTYSGATAVAAGTLILDYSVADISKLNDSAALVLGGGTLSLVGGAHTEVVASTTLAPGASTVTRPSGAAVLNMGAVTPMSGGKVNFTDENIALTTSPNVNGILGAWATIGGTNWAANAAGTGLGNIVAYSGYTDVAYLGGIIGDGSSNNVRIVTNGATSGPVTLGSITTTINSLMQGQPNATTNDTAAKTLRLGAVGSVLIPAGMGALTIGTAAGSGTLTAGGADNTAGVVTLINDDATSVLAVNAVVANNGSGTNSLAKSGVGSVKLSAVNTYSGSTTIGGGTLQITGAGQLGGGTYGGAITNLGTMVFGSSAAQTLNGVIAGTGTLIKTNSNWLYLGAANTFTGPFNILGGGVSPTTHPVLSTATSVTVSNATMEVRYGYYSVSWLTVSGLTLAGGATLQAANQWAIDNGDIGIANSFTVIGTNTIYARGGSYGKHNWLSGGMTGTTNAYLNLSNGAGYGAYADRRAIILSGGVWSNYLGTVNAVNDVTINGNIDLRNAKVIDAGSFGLYANNCVTEFGQLSGAGLLYANGKTGAEWRIGNLGTSSTYTGVIDGVSKVTKVGSGTLTLGGANTYSGATTVSNGVLAVSGGNAIGDSSAVLLANTAGVALVLNAAETVGSLAGGGDTGGSVSNQAYTLSSGGDNTTTTFDGVISGTGGLTKQGTGTMTLRGANLYTGATTVNGGVLVLAGANGSASGSTNITLGSGTALVLNNTAAANNGDRLGAGTVTLSGGTLTFTHNAGAADYSETLGALVAGQNSSTIGASRADPGRTSALTFSSLSRLGAATVNFTGTGLGTDARNQILFSTPPALPNGIIGSWATVNGELATYDIYGVVAVTGGYTDVTRLSSGSKVIPDGATNLVRIIEGTGTPASITLGAAVTTIDVLSQSTFGGTNPATIDLASQTLALNSILVADGAGGLTLGAGVNNGTLSNAGTGLGINNRSSGALTVNSVIGDGAGPNLLTKIGVGPLLLAGASTYSGGTVLNEGTIILGSTGALGAGTLTINGGVLDSSVVNLVNANGNAQVWNADIVFAGSQSLDLGTGAVSLGTGAGVSRTITVTNNNLTVSGGITNGTMVVNLVKAGAGTLTLSGSSVYTGMTTINAGKLEIGGAGKLGGGTYAGAISNSAALVYSSSAAQSFSGIMSGSGSFTMTGSGTLTLTQNNTYTGGTTINGGRLVMASSDDGTGTIRGVITVNTNGTLDWAVANALGYNANSITSLNIVGGTVGGSDYQIHFYYGGGSIPINMTGGNLILRGPAAVASANQFNSAPITVIASANTATITGSGVMAIRDSTVQTFTVGDGAQDVDLLVDVVISQNNGTSGITKSGTGKMSLTKTNAYTGATTISAGMLEVAGSGQLGAGSYAAAISIATNSTLLVNSTAAQTFSGIISGVGALTKTNTGALTLSGANTYTGVVTVAQGMLRLGSSNALSQADSIVLAGGTLDAGSNTVSVGTLTVTADSSIQLGTGSLQFTNSSAKTWSGKLSLLGTLGTQSLRFGTNTGGLTKAQLSQMNSLGRTVRLNNAGYVELVSGTLILVE